MAASHEQVAYSVNRLNWLVTLHPYTHILLKTNKRVLIWCDTYLIARHLISDLKAEDFRYIAAQGLRSQYYYIEVQL